MHMLRRSSNSSLVVSLRDARPSDEEIGRQARVLARLARLAIAVPPGVVVRHAAWLAYLDHHDGRAAWQAFEAAPDAERAAPLFELLKQAPLPATLLTALRELLHQQEVGVQQATTPTQARRPYVVRPTIDRLYHQQAAVELVPIYLFDANDQQLDAAIRGGWLSSFAAQLVGASFTSPQLRLSLLVQALPQLDCAGIVYTQTIRNEAALAIEATWGLAAPLVPAHSRPDQWLIARRTGRLLHHVAGERRVAHWLGASGVEEQVLEPWAPSPLTAAGLAQLRRVALQIERVLDQPQQIAWLHDGLRFWVVEVRPLADV